MRIWIVGALLLALACAPSPPKQRLTNLEKLRDALKLSDFPLLPPAECSGLDLSAIGAADVVVAIDSSRSTVDPTGFDIDRDAEVGQPALHRQGNVFDIGSTDPADSFLSAQVAGTRSAIHNTTPQGVRFLVLRFSSAGSACDPQARGGESEPYTATVESTLTSDAHELDAALSRILSAGSCGSTDFAAGIVLALSSLTNPQIQDPAPKQMILLLSDSPTPVLPSDTRPLFKSSRMAPPRTSDPAIGAAVTLALQAGIPIHTFGLGRHTAEEPGTLREIAEASNGAFTPVPDPALLHCALASALAH